MNKQLIEHFTRDIAATKKLSDELFQCFLESAVVHGKIDPRGKSEQEIASEFTKLMRGVANSGKFLVAIDHTPSLRDMAKKYERDNHPWLASVFYAMWVEHVLNDLVSIALSRRGEKEATTKQIIRDVSFHGKLTWLLPLLGYKPINSAHASRLNKLADYRNQFVHYKWSYIDFDTNEKEERNLVDFLQQCHASLNYLARYRNSETLPISKAKLRRSLARDGNS